MARMTRSRDELKVLLEEKEGIVVSERELASLVHRAVRSCTRSLVLLARLVLALVTVRHHPRSNEKTTRLLTASEVALLLAVNPERVYELARSRELRQVRLGERQTRFREQDVDDYIRRNTS